jgi:hypothetical protein
MSYNPYEGQQRINGELCRVDWKIIKVLRLIKDTLTAMHPPVSRNLLNEIQRAIDEADSVSDGVADIKPPGCIPDIRQDPDDPTYKPPVQTSQQPSV